MQGLPINTKYFLIDKKYIPLESSFGCTCDNCGRIIANIATIKSNEGQVYNIGFDCLDTILLKTAILHSNDLLTYELIKKQIPKIIRFSKSIKKTLELNNHITGIKFEKQNYTSDWFSFYWLSNNQTNSRNNDCVKLKELDFNFLIETLKNIFPKLNIITNH